MGTEKDYDLTPPPASHLADAGVNRRARQGRPPEWGVGEAKQRFTELLRRLEEEPQVICRRDQPIAALVRYDDFLEFQAWRQQHQARPLAAIIRGLTAACAEENFTLEVPPRHNRPTPFDEPFDELGDGGARR